MVTLLLCSAMIAALVSIPSAISQEFTTTTTTTQSTLTETTLSPAYAYQTTSVRVTLTLTSSETFFRLIPGTSGCNYGESGPLNVSSSGHIHIDYSTSQPSDLYVLTLMQWADWAMVGSTPACNPTSLAHYHVDSSASFDLSLDPSNNPYALVVICYSQPTQIKYAVGPLENVTMISRTFTLTQSVPVTSTGTVTSIMMLTQEIPFLQTSTGISTVAGAVIGGIVLFAVVYVLTKHRKRKEPKPSKVVETTPTEQEAPTETEVPEQKAATEQFCINCGTKLTANSKFCDRCGVKQP